uniref:Uncharacterized protein n=1 Tax=Rhizophora mucronata TaxID=61149 RepID=A0A2P2JK72_RHIMU
MLRANVIHKSRKWILITARIAVPVYYKWTPWKIIR